MVRPWRGKDHSVPHTPWRPSLWLNQVEIWFAKIERDVLARGVFESVSDLGRPIRWTYTDLRQRIGNAINGTVH
jgi:hypothetical protein